MPYLLAKPNDKNKHLAGKNMSVIVDIVVTAH